MRTTAKYGTAVILSGPSGSGKSSILRNFFQNHPEVSFSVSCTTRAPRPGEVHGKAYYFISEEEFQKKFQAGLFLETALVHGNHYGTLKTELTDRVAQGKNVILDIDVQGALSVKKICGTDPVLARCCEFVFVMPPSPEALEQRLRGRGTETEDVILRRLNNAREEMKHVSDYTYLIVNDDLSRAQSDFEILYRSFSLATRRIKEERP